MTLAKPNRVRTFFASLLAALLLVAGGTALTATPASAALVSATLRVAYGADACVTFRNAGAGQYYSTRVCGTVKNFGSYTHYRDTRVWTVAQFMVPSGCYGHTLGDYVWQNSSIRYAGGVWHNIPWGEARYITVIC